MSSHPFARALCVLILSALPAFPAAVGVVQGVVHDPSHRPVGGAAISLRALHSGYAQMAQTNGQGEFSFPAIPVGEYRVQVSQAGFAEVEQRLVVLSTTTPVMHFQLRLAEQRESIQVAESPEAINPQSSTTTTLISRGDIQRTPGADLSNSLAMITDYVPGAYITHDQLHVRGGHQVTWAIDGIPIPNTNIASNVGPQIDPKDIDYLEVQRGGYSSDKGDRIYGVFNVVPRTGFERNREMEINATAGSFHQTNNQINFGDHTQRFAYFGSVNGNRSDFGLGTPGPQVVHDRVWGLGGFGSLIFNKDAADQFRFVASVRRDDYQIPGPGVQDVERERDAVADFTWLRTITPSLLLTVSPFLHINRAHYDGDPNASPISTVQHLDSTYAGAQIALNAVTRNHNARAGVYGFGQRDTEFIGLTANDGSGTSLTQKQPSTGHLEAGFLEDSFKVTPWLTLTGGLRLTHFTGAVSENAASPRVGAAVRIPHLQWVVRGFYGRYYQAPPLSTVSGPLLEFAVTQGLGVIPLKGERNEENQVGLTIPIRGWTFDANSFRQRARNYFDHNAIGNSNIFFPLSIAGARIRGWEITARSPQIAKRAELSLAYSYQHAEAQGAITGGLSDFSPPSGGYFFLDHDQRHTLHGNAIVTLPHRAWASCSVYYGSGFVDGESETPRHLEAHTTSDFSIGKALSETLVVSFTALNITNRRFLLDNSLTFGGTHYADPRQAYVQLRYRFRL